MKCEWCEVSALWVFTPKSPVMRGRYGVRYACAAHRNKARKLTIIDGVECDVEPFAPLPEDATPPSGPTTGEEATPGTAEPPRESKGMVER